MAAITSPQSSPGLQAGNGKSYRASFAIMTSLFFLWSGFMIGPALLFPAESVERDFGYPQLTTNERGDVIDLYYWATKELPQQQIAATISKPGIRG